MATIQIKWRRPLALRRAKGNAIYECDLSHIPDAPGVYVFGRQHGDSFAPIYIGETLDLRSRITQHLQSVPLMMALLRAKAGHRRLHVGKLKRKPGQDPKSALQRAERAMIKHAQAQGYELINDKGTKTPYDEIHFSGDLTCRHVFGMQMHIEK